MSEERRVFSKNGVNLANYRLGNVWGFREDIPSTPFTFDQLKEIVNQELVNPGEADLVKAMGGAAWLWEQCELAEEKRIFKIGESFLFKLDGEWFFGNYSRSGYSPEPLIAAEFRDAYFDLVDSKHTNISDDDWHKVWLKFSEPIEEDRS
ncbi:hypothetical protein OZX56_05425 [Lactobacillus sp. ESL0684]|uniref:hypothetical protein n=1 Tax=Lactobacillus sp. ESL0684 TaxID=2983213 RepID=UPI0023FA2C38|nr:hypothetical protein [Lactobacillus sp. ESL0684]WEV42990.1 hypothetical protein OZX56_05425 [Lactobacillus sp. ESL0684]